MTDVVYGQPLGLWKQRQATDECIQLALGETHLPQSFSVDLAGFNVWHYWAESLHPEKTWKALRKRFGDAHDLEVAHNGEHPLFRLLLQGKSKAAVLWMEEASWPQDAKVGRSNLWHALAWSGQSSNFQDMAQHLDVATINDVDEDGLTPASIAVHRGGKDAVQQWLFAGADPDVVDQHKRTLLHHVAQYGDISWFTEVQDMGATETLKNDRNQTANDVLYDRMKHGTQTDLDILRHHWEKRYFLKCML